MDLIGEERGRLARVAGWLQASPAEVLGLAVLLAGAVVATAVLAWGALGRPTVPVGAGVDQPVGGDGTWSDVRDAGVAAGSSEPAGGDPDASAHGTGGGGPASTGADGGRHAGDADAVGGPAELVVHVTGAVATPGLVTVPAGARVADAVEAAGGMTDDADTGRINLAQPLVDGEQLRVLREGEEPPAATPPTSGPSGGTSTAAGSAGPVDLNRAGVDDLQALPGIGPTLAQRIVAHREEHGPFRAPGDLRQVSGIGERRFQDLAELVTVG